MLAVIALGGGLGGVARYLCTLAWPGAWGIFVVNVLGCALIGVLMVLVADAHPLVRPFLGVGVLGGFTTFSAYAIEFTRVGYLLLTVLCALSATAVAHYVTRRIVR